jgi:hypothetical protein
MKDAMILKWLKNEPMLLFVSLVAACLIHFPNRVHAQITGHYPAGVEGIKAASLPPPGFYIRDYNFVYFSDRLNDREGNEVPIKFHVSAYANVVRPVWITDWKILGADYGLNVVLPFTYIDLTVGAAKDQAFKLGDILVEPLMLAWHPEPADFVAAYGFWAPTGDFSRADPADPGKGFWSHMFTLGATWYPTENKTWAVSLLNRYEIHTRNDVVKITPGHSYTLEWAVSNALSATIDVGLIGYYQQQVTSDHGPGASGGSGGARDRVFAVGPEMDLSIIQGRLFTSLRYVREFSAKDRPEGNTLTLTLTGRW